MRVAYVVLALSLATTALVYYRVRINVDNRERARFERSVQNQKVSLEQSLPRYVDELLGVRGLFAANGKVSPEQWQQFLSSIEVVRAYPGTCTLGYLEQERIVYAKWLDGREPTP